MNGWLVFAALFVALGTLPAELAVIELRHGRLSSAALYGIFVVAAIYFGGHSLAAAVIDR